MLRYINSIREERVLVIIHRIERVAPSEGASQMLLKATWALREEAQAEVEEAMAVVSDQSEVELWIQLTINLNKWELVT